MKYHRAIPALLTTLTLSSGLGQTPQPALVAHAIPGAPMMLSLPPSWEPVPPNLMPLVEKVLAAHTNDNATRKFRPVALFTKGPLGQMNPVYGPSLWVIAAADLKTLDEALTSAPRYIGAAFTMATGKRGLSLFSRVEPVTVSWEEFGVARFATNATTVEGKVDRFVGWMLFAREITVGLLLASGTENPDAVVAEIQSAVSKLNIAAEQRLSAEDLAHAKASVAKMELPFAMANYNTFAQQAREARNVAKDLTAAGKAYDEAARVCEKALSKMNAADAAAWRGKWARTMLEKEDMLFAAKQNTEAAAVISEVRAKCQPYEKEVPEVQDWRNLFDSLTVREIDLARHLKDSARLRVTTQQWSTMWQEALQKPALPQEFRRIFAHRLFHAADGLRENKQFSDAATAVTSGLSALGDVAKEDTPDNYRQEFGRGLSQHARIYIQAGRRADAVAPSREAIQLFQALNAKSPDQYKMDLARAHSYLGQSLATKKTDPAAAEAISALRTASQLVEELKAKNLASEGNLMEAAFWLRLADALTPGAK
ncbi:MAG: hypothetical protein Q8M07_14635 [Prosthecobacter sp.]|nr:hypothetical protein [Prosthecobacter sp.]